MEELSFLSVYRTVENRIKGVQLLRTVFVISVITVFAVALQPTAGLYRLLLRFIDHTQLDKIT